MTQMKMEEDRRKYLQSKREIGGMRGLRYLGNMLAESALNTPFNKVLRTFGGGKRDVKDMAVEEILKVAKQVFDETDTDSSGGIDPRELQMCMKKMGYEINQETCEYMFDVIDTDGNGTLDWDEFQSFVRMFLRGDLPTEEEILKKSLQNSASRAGIASMENSHSSVLLTNIP